jgi:hypothetical protein
MINLKDVMEVWHQKLTHMRNLTLKSPGHNTLTLPHSRLAKQANTLELFILMDKQLFQLNLLLNLWLLF